VYEVPPVAVSVVELPEQIVAEAGEIVPVGVVAVVTVTEFEAGPLQSPWCIVAVYVPAWVTFKVAPVSPFISVPSRNHV
jgi:hypothetical protein